jgi:hypothetical protein
MSILEALQWQSIRSQQQKVDIQLKLSCVESAVHGIGKLHEDYHCPPHFCATALRLNMIKRLEGRNPTTP